MGDECNCLMASTFFSATLLGNWDEDWSFLSPAVTAGSFRVADMLSATP